MTKISLNLSSCDIKGTKAFEKGRNKSIRHLMELKVLSDVFPLHDSQSFYQPVCSEGFWDFRLGLNVLKKQVM